MVNRKDVLESKLHKNRMGKIFIITTLIFLTYCAIIFGTWYTLSSITENIIATTAFMGLVTLAGCGIILFLYRQIPVDKYDLHYNISLTHMENEINTIISIYNEHSKYKSIDEGLKSYKYFELKIIERVIDDGSKDGKGK